MDFRDEILDEVVKECKEEALATSGQGKPLGISMLGKYLGIYRDRKIQSLTVAAKDAAIRDLLSALVESDIEVDISKIARILKGL